MLYGKYVRTQDPFWYGRYEVYRDKLNSLIRKSKKIYYQDQFTKCLNNSKQIWSNINSLLNKGKENPSTEIFLNDNGELITNQIKVVNKFNDFFVNTGAKNWENK